VASALAAAVLAATSGCGKRSETQGGEGAAKAAPQVGAAEFYGTYSTLKGAELLEKYSAGVVVSGTVDRTLNLGGDEGFQLWLAVGGPGHIAVKFQDGGKAARQKKVKQGDPIAVRCQIGGKPEEVLYLVDCALAEAGAQAATVDDSHGREARPPAPR
jgi:hypothetical protein